MSRPRIRARGFSGSRRTCGSTASAPSSRNPNRIRSAHPAGSRARSVKRRVRSCRASRRKSARRWCSRRRSTSRWRKIAEALSTTPGTVKSALHRGRGKLIEPKDLGEAPPRPQILDAFCAAFNAGDLDRLISLLLDTAEIEVVRVHTEYGPEAARRGVFQGMLFGLADPARLDGLDPAFFRNVLPSIPRVEPRLHRGEWLLVHWYPHSDGDAVRAISRIEADGDRLTRVRNYFFTPDVLAEICAELQISFRSNGYRYWRPS